MVPSEMTVKVALVPLNATAVAPVNLSPKILTAVPTGEYAGSNVLILGGPVTVKRLSLTAPPLGVDTVMGPVDAAAGTVAWMTVSEVTVKVAFLPLNHTSVAPVKIVPLMVTLVPAGPLVGEKLAIVGAGPFGLPPSHAEKVNAGLNASIPTSPLE
jgi:hypothetical protein